MCVCVVCERERECVGVCVCVCERERERERVWCVRGLHGLKTEARTRPVPEIV